MFLLPSSSSSSSSSQLRSAAQAQPCFNSIQSDATKSGSSSLVEEEEEESDLPSPMASSSPSLMDSLFQRTLDDIIKGLRHHQAGDSVFISKVLEEIRREIKSTDLHTKSTALHKLTYLHSIHFLDMSWAAFHAIECISSSNFSHKKIGYLAISQSFHESTPVILLITNQLRKDLKSNTEAEVSLALECLSRTGNLDLCRDLTPEVFTLMATSKLVVKKKAIGLLLRVFGKYPDSVRVCFKRLVESLESGDDSPQIVSAVIGVFCELASRDPKAYLPLAPEFFKILVNSRNNWVLIKVLKIFTKLAPLEPRLAKKIVEPICDLMRKTGAKSLMFECIRTILTSLTDYESAVRVSAGRINELLVDEDPNLRYLGLHALALIAPKHIWAVLENKEVVIKSLSDADPNIKLESLRLVMAMMSDSNIVEICRVLMNYATKSEPEFCNQILGSILSTCSHNVYEIVVDFDWYVSLLGEMSRIPNCQKGEEIENQLIDIAMRVKDVRPELVHVAHDLVIDPALLGNCFLHRILSSAAWVCGEYVEFTRRPVELLESLLQPRTSLLPTSVRSVYLESAFKALIFCLHSCMLNASRGEFSELATEQEFNPRVSDHSNGDISGADGEDSQASRCNLVEEKYTTSPDPMLYLFNLIDLAVSPLSGSYDVEIQERTRNILGFVELIRPELSNSSSPEDAQVKEGNASTMVRLLHDAFLNELGPISTSAQGRVAVPDGLVLHENLADLEAICGSSEVPASSSISLESYYNEEDGSSIFIADHKEKSQASTESTSLLVEHRKRHGLYYLSPEKKEHVENDYPPANDPKSIIGMSDDAEDLVKLAEQSFLPKRKSKQVKARPVVVKLDEGDVHITSRKPEAKDDSLSDAVRDVLLGNEAEAGSSRQNSPAISLPDKKKGKVREDSDKVGSQQQIPAKDRSKTSGKKDGDQKDKAGDMEKQKRKHRHAGRHKARATAQVPSNVTAQTSVVPDLLL